MKAYRQNFIAIAIWSQAATRAHSRGRHKETLDAGCVRHLGKRSRIRIDPPLLVPLECVVPSSIPVSSGLLTPCNWVGWPKLAKGLPRTAVEARAGTAGPLVLSNKRADLRELPASLEIEAVRWNFRYGRFSLTRTGIVLPDDFTFSCGDSNAITLAGMRRPAKPADNTTPQRYSPKFFWTASANPR